METLRAIVIYMAVTAMLVKFAVGADHTVGAPSGSWDLNTDLSTWATSQKFSVGDNLIFQYTPLHSVFQVSKADYDACQTDTPIQSFTGGTTTILLSPAGKRYFICGTGGHCGQGMKVEIDTVAASTTPPPSPPSTTPSPPSTPSPPPSTTPPSTPSPPPSTKPPPTVPSTPSPPSPPPSTTPPSTPSPPPSTKPPPTVPSTPSPPSPVKPPPAVPSPLPPSTPSPASSPKTSPTSPSTSMEPSETPTDMDFPPVTLSPPASQNNGHLQVKPAMGLGFGIMMLLAL